MLSFLVVLGASSCVRQESLLGSITVAKRNVTAGETVCFSNLPPYTSVIFKHIPPSSIVARYLLNGRGVVLSSQNLTAGFDTGAYSGEVEVTTKRPGMFSYFVVTFPSDCQTRIISSQRQEVHVHGSGTGKVCYFNRGHKKLEYVIEISGNETGVLESSGLNLRLTGNATKWLHDQDPSLITWSGEVNSVHIAVFGGHKHHGGVKQILNGTDPVLIKYPPFPWFGHHGHHHGPGEHPWDHGGHHGGGHSGHHGGGHGGHHGGGHGEHHGGGHDEHHGGGHDEHHGGGHGGHHEGGHGGHHGGGDGGSWVDHDDSAKGRDDEGGAYVHHHRHCHGGFGVLVLAGIIGIVYCCCRARRNRARQEEEAAGARPAVAPNPVPNVVYVGVPVNQFSPQPPQPAFMAPRMPQAQVPVDPRYQQGVPFWG